MDNLSVYNCLRNFLINSMQEYKFTKFVSFDRFNFDNCGYEFLTIQLPYIIPHKSDQRYCIYNNKIISVSEAIEQVIFTKRKMMSFEIPMKDIIRIFKNLE